jgi:gas vesicle protein
MGESTEELNHDIEETRNRLGGHLDELQDKVSPAAIADRKKEAAKAKVVGFKEKALGTARAANDATPSPSPSAASDTAKQQFHGAPLAAGVAAFGLGMVIAALIPATEAESKAAVQVKDAVQDKAQPLMEDAKAAATDIGQNLKDSAAESAQQVKATGTEAVANVKDEGQSSVETVRSDVTP